MSAFLNRDFPKSVPAMLMVLGSAAEPWEEVSKISHKVFLRPSYPKLLAMRNEAAVETTSRYPSRGRLIGSSSWGRRGGRSSAARTRQAPTNLSLTTTIVWENGQHTENNSRSCMYKWYRKHLGASEPRPSKTCQVNSQVVCCFHLSAHLIRGEVDYRLQVQSSQSLHLEKGETSKIAYKWQWRWLTLTPNLLLSSSPSRQDSKKNDGKQLVHFGNFDQRLRRRLVDWNFTTPFHVLRWIRSEERPTKYTVSELNFRAKCRDLFWELTCTYSQLCQMPSPNALMGVVG